MDIGLLMILRKYLFVYLVDAKGLTIRYSILKKETTGDLKTIGNNIVGRNPQSAGNIIEEKIKSISGRNIRKITYFFTLGRGK